MDREAVSIAWQDLCIYELHVKGLTKHHSSGVKAENSGTFAGVIEKIPYLKNLGINAVKFMPIYDFAEWSMNRTNYWGFCEDALYFAPQTAYASNNGNRSPIEECKAMITALHEQGIAVFLEFYFGNGVSWKRSLAVLQEWKFQYHVDGFHIMGNADYQTIAREPLFINMKLMADAWGEIDNNAGNVAIYRSSYRDNLRRFLCQQYGETVGGATCALQEFSAELPTIHFIADHDGFCLADIFAYNEKHNEANGDYNLDGPCGVSWNCGIEGEQDNPSLEKFRHRMICNAVVLLLLSQGPVQITAGDEMGGSHKGNNNAWCQDNEISWIDWNNITQNQDIYKFFKDMLAFRKKHSIFHQSVQLFGKDYLNCGQPDISFHGKEPWKLEEYFGSKLFGVLYDGHYVKDKTGKCENTFYVACNMSNKPEQFRLPTIREENSWIRSNVNWQVCIEVTPQRQQVYDGESDDNNSIIKINNIQDCVYVIVPEYSVLLFMQRSGDSY